MFLGCLGCTSLAFALTSSEQVKQQPDERGYHVTSSGLSQLSRGVVEGGGSKAFYQLCAGARSLPDIGFMLGLRAAYDHAYTSASQLQCELADHATGLLNSCKKPQIYSAMLEAAAGKSVSLSDSC